MLIFLPRVTVIYKQARVLAIDQERRVFKNYDIGIIVLLVCTVCKRIFIASLSSPVFFFSYSSDQ